MKSLAEHLTDRLAASNLSETVILTLPECAHCGAIIPAGLGQHFDGRDYCDMLCQQEKG